MVCDLARDPDWFYPPIQHVMLSQIPALVLSGATGKVRLITPVPFVRMACCYIAHITPHPVTVSLVVSNHHHREKLRLTEDKKFA